MRYTKLQQLKERPYFGINDLADIFNIKPESARVLCSRYTKNGFFVRIKRNLYILREKWDACRHEDLLKIANILQVPSYISYMTALSLYGLTTQVQQNFLESSSLKRSLKADIEGVSFNYYKLKKIYYFDFVKKDGYFIATPEKALADTAYLCSFGKYKADFNSLDIKKLNKKKLNNILKVFPDKTKAMLVKICKI